MKEPNWKGYYYYYYFPDRLLVWFLFLTSSFRALEESEQENVDLREEKDSLTTQKVSLESQLTSLQEALQSAAEAHKVFHHHFFGGTQKNMLSHFSFQTKFKTERGYFFISRNCQAPGQFDREREDVDGKRSNRPSDETSDGN